MALDQFKTGKLPAMLTRAGIRRSRPLSTKLIAGKLPEVLEARAHAMLQG